MVAQDDMHASNSFPSSPQLYKSPHAFPSTAALVMWAMISFVSICYAKDALRYIPFNDITMGVKTGCIVVNKDAEISFWCDLWRKDKEDEVKTSVQNGSMSLNL